MKSIKKVFRVYKVSIKRIHESMQRKNKKITIIHSNLYSAFIVYKSFLQSITYIHIGIRSSYLVPYMVNIRPAPNLYAHAHQTYTSLFTYTIPTYKYTRMDITITLSLQFMCMVSILPTPPPPQLYAHAYNHRSERIRTCLLSYNYTLLPSKSITSFLSTYITPERDNNP